MMRVRLDKPELYSFHETHWFLDRNLDDCMHRVTATGVQRLVDSPEGAVFIDVRESGEQLVCAFDNGSAAKRTFVAEYVREWFDLDRNIRPFYALLRKDPDFSGLARKYSGFRIVGIPDLFECLCWCIMGQQISLPFAYMLKRRLVERYGAAVRGHFLFPSPEVLADLPVSSYRELQFTNRKGEYIKGVARLFADGSISKQKLSSMNDDATMEALLSIRGIGEWTANYVMMKSLGRMNCVPWGDAGINKAMHNLKGISGKHDRPALERVFEAFEGWKTYLVYYLWRTLR